MIWAIIFQEAPAFGGINGCQTVETEENLQLGGQKHAALSESLKSSLNHLNNEVFLCSKVVFAVVILAFHYLMIGVLSFKYLMHMRERK